MQEHLSTLGVAAKRFLAMHLPKLGDGWWERGVVSALSYQQRQLAAERGWSSLEELDLAALLRVIDGNWDFFRQQRVLGYEVRNWLKEAGSVRNRWAHEPPGVGRDPRRDYRDLDTLALLADALDPTGPDAATLTAARDRAGDGLSLPTPVAAAVAVDVGDLTPGAMVRLAARKETVGVVTRITPGGREGQIHVFHDGAEHAYFESQIEFVDSAGNAKLTPDDMRAGLTAALLLHPATSRLYSFNSGRIDYEPYQFRPVLKLINADRPRLLVADDVGVGKTIEAGLIIKELQARQPLESVLVVCPKQLVVEGKWRQELKRFDEDFIELDGGMLRYCIRETRLEGVWPRQYRKAIIPYSLLDERLLLGEGQGRQKRHGLVDLVPPATFDLVIVDEAHHIRNRDTWAYRVVEHLLDSAEAAVLISATPIQTGSDDLFTLLRVLRPDVLLSKQDFERMREPNAFIARAEQSARKGEAGWQKAAITQLDLALATPWGAAVMVADPRAQIARDLLESAEPTDEVRVLAVRALQSLNTFSGLINRTRRRDIGAFTVRKPETIEVDFTAHQAAIYADLLDLCTRIISTQRPSQSTEFLLSTLKRQASSSLNGLAPFVADVLNRRLDPEELSEADFDGDWSQGDGLASFHAEIQELAMRAAQLDEDPKLDALTAAIREKQSLENNKLLVFSTFRHTLRYLLPQIEAAGVRVGLVHGGVEDEDRRELRARFALDRSDPGALDVLLSSEVGTEGLDNQFCDALVNYDIPWNPMRIEQRIGRIDRRGQKSESIAIKNLVVRGTVDAAIYNRCLQRIGVFRQSLGGSEEILGELTREMRTIAEDLTLTDTERDEKLRQLADNKLARIQEQSELEDCEAMLFGLAVQKLDESGVEAAVSPWLTPARLAGLVARYLLDRGYERASALFDRPVAVLRPDKSLRSVLLDDARALGAVGAAVTRWTHWLDGSGEQTRRLTFDPQLADRDDIELLSSTHPLVRAAAAHAGALSPDSEVSLTVEADEMPPGRYPFAVYGWTTLGLRDGFEIRVVTPSPDHDEPVSRLLQAAGAGSATLRPAETEQLYTRHYDLWADERGLHLERTRAHVAAQRGSLQLTHTARIAQLEDQLAGASHESIRRMRESQLRSAEADFQRRSQDLRQATDRCDITSVKLCQGVLEVR